LVLLLQMFVQSFIGGTVGQYILLDMGQQQLKTAE